MKPMRARYQKIEKLVDALLGAHGIVKPAVPITRVVKQLQIELKYGDLGDVSGLIVRSANGASTIGVNAQHPEVRQRFTIAHELGHSLLHTGLSEHLDRDYRVNFRSKESSEATDVEEIEANFFAASILMPRQFLLTDDAVKALDNDFEVAKLAKRYNVSRHAMSLRLANVYKQFSPF